MSGKRQPRGPLLCVLGPGGDYRDAVRDSGPGWSDLDRSPLPEDRRQSLNQYLAEQLDVFHAANAARQVVDCNDARVWGSAERPLPPVVFGSLSAYLAEEYDATRYEEAAAVTDSEAVPATDVHSGLHACPRVRADHAGVGRRTRGKQGHRVRTHHLTTEKGLAASIPTQGTLFAT